MGARSNIALSLTNVSLLSSDTSTAVPTAVDLANYFPVGRRSVKAVINTIPSSTALGVTASVTIQECASTSTANFTNVLTVSGSTATVTSTANSVAVMTELEIVSSLRYIRAIYTGATSTGGTIALAVTIFPLVRSV